VSAVAGRVLEPRRAPVRAAAPGRPLRVLTLTSLYPSSARPRHGVFVETRLQHMAATGAIDARVIAPVPWFPLRAGWCGRYADFARTPRGDCRGGIPVGYPRYFMLPAVGMGFQPDAMAVAALRAARTLAEEGFDCDVVDAHYAYPDGVAAALVARRLGKPYVITARGSDINLLGAMDGPRRRMVEAADGAAALIAVSDALRARMEGLGMPGERIHVLRNGVDARLFAPVEREAARDAFALPVDATVLACVANLVPEKGVDLFVEAVGRMPRVHGIVVGEGPQRAKLVSRAMALGIGARMRFVPNMPQSRLRYAYSAADVLVLASSREGWPNVLLEAMACGTPVVATGVGGVAEIVTRPAAGRIAAARSADAVVDAARAVLEAPPAREAVRAHALAFGWDSIAAAQVALLRRAAGWAPC
jgi:teichuronic acid biosynthesis glycosyltransferase TuaC